MPEADPVDDQLSWRKKFNYQFEKCIGEDGPIDWHPWGRDQRDEEKEMREEGEQERQDKGEDAGRVEGEEEEGMGGGWEEKQGG